MSTIPDYPAPVRALDGTEPLAGWQDGAQRAIPARAIADLVVKDALGAVAPLVARAEAAATSIDGLRAQVASGLVPLCDATAGTTASRINLVPPPNSSFANAGRYRFLPPSTPNDVVRINGLALLYDNGVAVGPEARITTGVEIVVRYDGAPSNVFRFVANTLDTIRLANAETKIDTDSVRLTVAENAINRNAERLNASGSHFCTATGSGNAITLTAPAGISFFPGTEYRFLAPATPTTAITINGVALLYENGGVVGPDVGFRKDWEIEVRYDGPPSNVFRLTGASYDHQRLSELERLNAADLLDNMTTLRDAPYGTVGANNAVTRTQFQVVGCGDSNSTDKAGRQPGAPVGYAINDVLSDKLNARTLRQGIQYVSENCGFGGEVFNQFAMRLGESGAFRDGLAKIVNIAGVTNSAEIGNYNSGQSYSGGKDALLSLLKYNAGRGYLTLVWTFPPPYTEIRNYRAFYDANPSYPQYYPRYIASNVDPNTGMYPPAFEADGVTPGSKKLIDMTGNGQPIWADLRYLHVNQMIRDVCRLFPKSAIVMDWEMAGARAIEQYGQAVMFDQPSSGVNEVHYSAFAHRVGSWPVMDEFVADWSAGRRLKRIYTGEIGRDNVNAWPALTASAFGSSGQAVAAGAWTTVILPTVEIARGLSYDTTTGLVTITQAGVYQLTGSIGMQATTNGGPITAGVGLINQEDGHSVSVGIVSGTSTKLADVACSRLIQLKAGDQPRLYVQAGQASNVRKAAFSIARIR